MAVTAHQRWPILDASNSPTGIPAPLMDDPILVFAAEIVNDLEDMREANEHRLRRLTNSKTDKDGVRRGLGLAPDDPDVVWFADLVDTLKQLEATAVKLLERGMRRHPLYPWVKRSTGCGEKQTARLLAEVGDPYWNALHGRPRTLRELYGYCGYGVINFPAEQDIAGDSSAHSGGLGGDSTRVIQAEFGSHTLNGDANSPDRNHNHDSCDNHSTAVGVAVRRQRGVKSNWSAAAKMRAYLIADQCVKGLRAPCGKADADHDHATHVEGCRCYPYRRMYDQAREKYATAVHRKPCPQCGKKNQPAPPGSALSKGHRDMRATRFVAKEILKDLWREAKTLHETQGKDHNDQHVASA